jgi:hypothetical protein
MKLPNKKIPNKFHQKFLKPTIEKLKRKFFIKKTFSCYNKQSEEKHGNFPKRNFA